MYFRAATMRPLLGVTVGSASEDTTLVGNSNISQQCKNGANLNAVARNNEYEISLWQSQYYK